MVRFFREYLHGGETAGGGIVGERRLADAVEGVTRVAAKIVVEALDGVGDVERSGKPSSRCYAAPRDSASPVVGGVPVGDDGFVGERAESVVDEGRDAGRVMRLDLAAEGVVGEDDRWGSVGVIGARERAPVVVGVGRVDAARPSALGEAPDSVVYVNSLPEPISVNCSRHDQ